MEWNPKRMHFLYQFIIPPHCLFVGLFCVEREQQRRREWTAKAHDDKVEKIYEWIQISYCGERKRFYSW